MKRLTTWGCAASMALALTAAATSIAAAQPQQHFQRGAQPRAGRAVTARPPVPPRGRPPAPPPGRAIAPRLRAGVPSGRLVTPGRPVTRIAPNRFATRNFSRFTPTERRLWTSGHWRQDWHNNMFGWWWVVGGLWYFYPAPIYPYPLYASDYWWEEPAAPIYPTGYWYYCSTSGAYYPHVQTCDVPWMPVTPTPAG
jgi:hypothetical protein